MATYGFCENKCKQEVYTKNEVDSLTNIDTTLSVPTLQNGWVEYMSGQNFIYKIKDIVYLNLGVKSGTAKKILTLPEGFRPSSLKYYPCVNLSNRTASVFSINTEGVVTAENSEIGSDLFINVTFKVK